MRDASRLVLSACMSLTFILAVEYVVITFDSTTGTTIFLPVFMLILTILFFNILEVQE